MQFTLSDIRATRQFLRLPVRACVEWMRDQVALFCAEQPTTPRTASVVAPGYQKRYVEAGDPRGCGDWLHRVLAARTLDDKQRLIVPHFEAILDLNGVKHSHWNRTTPGWQGRLRMSGSVALRATVKRTGVLHTLDGAIVV